ncbi:hypothetical protein BC829DRAFT_384933 [Chytridium lagenaria]|nr:hypothetical protein BC829DRAFT_384933 [Chytridium lagenaria]
MKSRCRPTFLVCLISLSLGNAQEPSAINHYGSGCDRLYNCCVGGSLGDGCWRCCEDIVRSDCGVDGCAENVKGRRRR